MYYLQKEAGLTHSDIFGSREVVPVEKESSRDGFIGTLKDAVLGKDRRTELETVRSKAMNAKTFMTYIDLMEEDAKRREKQGKKGRTRGKAMKTLGGV